MKFEEYIYVDYENVQNINVDVLKKTSKLILILGSEQTKNLSKLIQKTQKLKKRIEWVQLKGKGKNALDFFVTFYLGRDITLNKEKKFIIYSKDTGYDVLISYLKKEKINIKRTSKFNNIYKGMTLEKIDMGDKMKNEVVNKLIKISKEKRPKKRKSLKNFIASIQRNASEKEINSIIKKLLEKNFIREENGLILY
jgi:hypothetical protein